MSVCHINTLRPCRTLRFVPHIYFLTKQLKSARSLLFLCQRGRGKDEGFLFLGNGTFRTKKVQSLSCCIEGCHMDRHNIHQQTCDLLVCVISKFNINNILSSLRFRLSWSPFNVPIWLIMQNEVGRGEMRFHVIYALILLQLETFQDDELP